MILSQHPVNCELLFPLTMFSLFSTSGIFTWLSTCLPNLRVVIDWTDSCAWVGLEEPLMAYYLFRLGIGWLGNFLFSLSQTWFANWPTWFSNFEIAWVFKWVELFIPWMAWLVDCMKVLRDSSRDDCCFGGAINWGVDLGMGGYAWIGGRNWLCWWLVVHLYF